VLRVLGLLGVKWTYLVGGVLLIGFGLVAYYGARPAEPVEIDGTISDYIETTSHGAYSGNTLQLAGDSTTYMLDKNTFHPTMPDGVWKDGKVQIWIDRGSTTIIGITLYDENDEHPIKYTTDHYDNPGSEVSDTQNSGIAGAVIGGALVAIFGAWFVVGQRRNTQLPGGAPRLPASVTGSSVGVSSDGKWYWDLAQWRPVSEDGHFRWDGTQWQEMGTVYSAKGAPAPPGA